MNFYQKQGSRPSFPNNERSFEKEAGTNVDQTRTDDLAASSPTIEEIQTQDMYRFGKHSGALIVASATSDFS